jgi:phage terminase large subunit
MQDRPVVAPILEETHFARVPESTERFLVSAPEYKVDFRPLPELMNEIPYRLVNNPPVLFETMSAEEKEQAKKGPSNRYVISRGGSGSGKSVGEGQKIVYYTTAQPGRNTLVIRQVADTNRGSTFNEIVKAINRFNLNDLYKIRETDLTITCINGNQIIFKGLDDVQKVKSVTFQRGILTDIWIEEASEITEEDFDEIDLRLRGKEAPSFQITLTFNPIDSMHWIKQRFYDNHDPRATCVLSTYKDNKWCDDETKKNMEILKTKNAYLYQVYACGEWGNAGDIVFQNAKYEPCPYTYEDFDEVLAGQDFGYEHHNAIELIGFKDGRLYSFRELYVNKKLTPEIIDLNEHRNIMPKTQRCICDCAEPKSIGDWRTAGYSITEAKKPPDAKRTQLQFLAGSDWTIDPIACPGLTAEVRGFSYRKDKNGTIREIDEAQGISDDAVDAVRYAISQKIKNTKFVLW